MSAMLLLRSAPRFRWLVIGAGLATALVVLFPPRLGLGGAGQAGGSYQPATVGAPPGPSTGISRTAQPPPSVIYPQTVAIPPSLLKPLPVPVAGPSSGATFFDAPAPSTPIPTALPLTVAPAATHRENFGTLH